ncbi:MAG: PEGA domain-containing protein [Ignavibacteriales bacterium]|nr:PEGA domain-containing protein [Ignavibacteriales bacterium]
MKITFISKIFLLTIILISCESENPIATETGNGKIVVNANVDKGIIYVDEKFTGKFTPDTLELFAVKHLIKVRKEGYFSEQKEIAIKKDEVISEIFILTKNNLSKNVLLETFTNSGCDSCKNSNELFSNLMNKYPQRLFILNHPTRYPNQNDPMNLEVMEDVNKRLEYYIFFDVPQYVIDGNKNNLIEITINEQLNKLTKLEITVIDSLISGDGLTIDVFLDVYDLDEIDFSSLVLRIALIENSIIFETPPGTNGQKEFNYILRGMIPDYKGISLAGIDKVGRAKFAKFMLLKPR